MGGIGIVSNPHSRRNRRYPEQMRRLAYVLGEGDVDATTKSVDAVESVAQRFRDADIDILALNGGDGTNHVTLTSFVKVYGDQPLPLIALLRGGTMNTVSNAIGIRGQPNALLVNIVEKYHLGHRFEISERDLMKVTDVDGSSYGFIFGTGLISNFLSLYYATGNPSPTTAARLLVRAAGSVFVRGPTIRKVFQPARGALTVDDQPWLEGEFSTVAASTIEQIGLGFRPFVRCEALPGYFHAIAVSASAPRVVGMLPAIRLGKPLDQEAVPDAIARKLVFESESPVEYTIDGDLHCAGNKVTVQTGPRLRIIVK